MMFVGLSFSFPSPNITQVGIYLVLGHLSSILFIFLGDLITMKLESYSCLEKWKYFYSHILQLWDIKGDSAITDMQCFTFILSRGAIFSVAG